MEQITKIKQLHDESKGFFITPHIPKKLFANSIKSYAKYVTSRKEKILALYDGGRSGKEGFAITEQSLVFRDAYGNFGGSKLADILGYEEHRGGDPDAPFPVIEIMTRDSSPIHIGFAENPQASEILKKILSDLPPCSDAKKEKNWAESLYENFPHMPRTGIYKFPYIPDTVLENALQAYGGKDGIQAQQVIIVFEYRAPGTEGFLLTDNMMSYNMGYENQGSLILDNIRQVKLTKEKKINRLEILSAKGKSITLQFIIHPEAANILMRFLQNKLNDKIASCSDPSEQIPHDPENRLFQISRIDENYLGAIKKNFLPSRHCETETPIYFYDNSHKNSGESGCLVTDRALYIKQGGMHLTRIAFEQIKSYTHEIGPYANHIRITVKNNKQTFLSFYPFENTLETFLHYLRVSFPYKETTSQEDWENSPIPVKYIRKGQRKRGRLFHYKIHGLVLLSGLASVFLFHDITENIFGTVIALCMLLILPVYGLTCIFQRSPEIRSFLKIRLGKHKKEVMEAENAKFEGSAVAALGKNNWLYKEERKQNTIFWQSVPFYIINSQGAVLVSICNETVGLYKKRNIEEGDYLYACGKLTKQSDSYYELENYGSFPHSPAAISDTPSGLGTSFFDFWPCIIDIVSGTLILGLYIQSFRQLFLNTANGGRSGLEMLFYLFLN